MAYNTGFLYKSNLATLKRSLQYDVLGHTAKFHFGDIPTRVSLTLISYLQENENFSIQKTYRRKLLSFFTAL